MNEKSVRTSREFDDSVCDRFLVGARQTCSKKIWKWIVDNRFEGLTNKAIADGLDVDRATVGRWANDGKLEFDRLVLLMVLHDFDFDSLSRPTTRHLAVGGYIAATTLVRKKLLSQDLDRMTAEQFCCIWSLHRRLRKWKLLQRQMLDRPEGQAELQTFSESLAQEADQLLSSYLNDVPEQSPSTNDGESARVSIRTTQQFQTLNAEWGDAWDACRSAVYRYSWLELV